MHRAIAALFLLLIRAYQLLLSPWLGSRCRFTPTCSAYAAEAVRVWGPWKGVRLALHRLSRCRPGGGAGWDPVPERK